jgi:hypothetical protein
LNISTASSLVGGDRQATSASPLYPTNFLFPQVGRRRIGLVWCGFA